MLEVFGIQSNSSFLHFSVALCATEDYPVPNSPAPRIQVYFNIGATLQPEGWCFTKRGILVCGVHPPSLTWRDIAQSRWTVMWTPYCPQTLAGHRYRCTDGRVVCEPWLRVRLSWGSSCVTMSKLFNFSDPQCPPLYNGRKEQFLGKPVQVVRRNNP